MALRPLLRARLPPSEESHGGAYEPDKGEQFPSALSPDGRLLCLATERRSLACYRLRGPNPTTTNNNSAAASSSSSSSSEEAFVLDFDEQEVEGVTPPVPVAITCLQWVGPELLAIGFSTGLLRVVDGDGNEVNAVRFQSAPLLRVRLYPPRPVSRYADMDLWLLFGRPHPPLPPPPPPQRAPTASSSSSSSSPAPGGEQEGTRPPPPPPVQPQQQQQQPPPPGLQDPQQPKEQVAVVVPLYCLAGPGGAGGSGGGGGSAPPPPLVYTRYVFPGTEEVADLAVFPRQWPKLFEAPHTTATSTSTATAPNNPTHPLDGSHTSVGTTSSSGGINSPLANTINPGSGSSSAPHFLLTVGHGPTVGFYALGGARGNYRGLAELVSAVKQRITRAVVGTVGTLLPFAAPIGLGLLKGAAFFPSRLLGRGVGAEEGEQGEGGGAGGGDGGDPFAPAAIRVAAAAAAAASEGGQQGGKQEPQPEPDPVGLSRDMGLSDPRRRALSASLDPSGRLCAVADALGRVMVVDVWAKHVVRLFKGHRRAQVGWLEALEGWPGQAEGQSMPSSSSSSSQGPIDGSSSGGQAAGFAVGLYLVIYSPTRSLLEIWRMRHGPCVRVLPAPPNLTLLTLYPSTTNTNGGGLGGGGGGKPGVTSAAAATAAAVAAAMLTRCCLVRLKEPGGLVTAARVELGEAEVAPLLRLRAQGSAAREDAYHLRRVRLLLQRRGRRAWERERERGEGQGGVDSPIPIPDGAAAPSGGGGGRGRGRGVGEAGDREGRAEEQLLLDLVHRIRAPRCLCQVVALLDQVDDAAPAPAPSPSSSPSPSPPPTAAALAAKGAAALSVDVQRQATLLALDACLLATTTTTTTGGARSGGGGSSKQRPSMAASAAVGGGGVGGGGSPTKLDGVVRGLRTRERLLQAYQLVIDMGPEALPGAALTLTPNTTTATALMHRLLPPSPTTPASEPAAWAALRPTDEETAALAAVLNGYTRPLSVPAFLRACRGGGGESKGEGEGEGSGRQRPASVAAGGVSEGRGRGEALRLVMRPLLHDVFAVKSLEEVLSCLHWGPREAMLAAGEWFLSLPAPLAAWIAAPAPSPNTLSTAAPADAAAAATAAATAAAASSPLARWLAGRLAASAATAMHCDEEEGDEEGVEGGGGGTSMQAAAERALDPLFALCQATPRLEQALALAELCRGLTVAHAQAQEARSLGAHPSKGAGRRWLRLKRQLRVCLFLAGRLGLEGPAREPPAALDTGAASLFGMLASDELTLAAGPQECRELERRCALLQHRRALRHATTATAPKEGGEGQEEEAEEEGVDAWGPTADVGWPALVAAVRKARHHHPHSPPPLLLYFRHHAQPLPLAAHRARCLAALWAASPDSKEGPRRLVAAKEHLHAVAAEDARLGAAIALDLWGRFLAPALRPYASNQSTIAPSLLNPSVLGAMHGVLYFLLRGLPPPLPAQGEGQQGQGQQQGQAQAGFDRRGAVLGGTQGAEAGAGEEVWPLVDDRYCFEALSRLEGQGQATGGKRRRVPTEWAVRSHMALLQVMALLGATGGGGGGGVHPQALFPPAHHRWCRDEEEEGGLYAPKPPALEAVLAALEAGPEREGRRAREAAAAQERDGRRKALLVWGLGVVGREASQVVYAAGEALGVPVDWLRRAHVLRLLAAGDDVLAEDLMVQVEQVGLLAGPVLQLVRRRLKGVLGGLRRGGGRGAQVLATLDADTSEWVLAAAGGGDHEGGGDAATAADSGLGEEERELLALAMATTGGGSGDGTPGTPTTTTTTTTTARPASLAGTHAVLLRLLGLLPPDKKSPHHTRVRALAGLCSELLQALAPPGDTVAAAITGP